MNGQFISLAAGLVLTTGAGGALSEMPPDASLSQWLLTFGIAMIGLLSMFIATTYSDE